MKIIAVDDEEIALENLESAIHEAKPSAEVAAFDKSSAALAYASENKCAAAFRLESGGGFIHVLPELEMKL